jgi:hypothetical protein
MEFCRKLQSFSQTLKGEKKIMKMYTEPHGLNDYLNQKWKIGIIAVLFAVFIWDSLAAIEEAKAQQQAYREGKTQVEAIDLSSVENMLKSMGI